MTRLQQILISLVVLGGAAAGPALAASSASSASSEGASASVGSLSTSIEKSSNSSSKGDKVAEGDYHIVQMVAVAAADKQPAKVRLTLRALNPADGEFFLTLPQEAVQQGRLVEGVVVTARQHAYGVQFAAGAPREAFFLVLQDAWYQELQTKAVTL